MTVYLAGENYIYDKVLSFKDFILTIPIQDYKQNLYVTMEKLCN